MSWYEYAIYGISILTLVGQAMLALIVLSYASGRAEWRGFIERRVLAWMFVVALASMAGSLFFSEVAGIEPCVLCWYQRIAMYPQVALLAVALWKNDRSVAAYVLPLCVIGGAIAAWHYGEHLWTAFHPFDPTEPCSLDGISCAVPPFWHFGYITIPLMALTGFALNAVGSTWLLRRSS